MKIQGRKLIVEYDSELISLEIMLEDLPYYLSLDGVNLSAICESQRKEFLKKIKIILNKISKR